MRRIVELEWDYKMREERSSRAAGRRPTRFPAAARRAAARAAAQSSPGRWVADSEFSWLPVVMMFCMMLYLCVPQNVLEGHPPLSILEEAAAGPNPLYRVIKYGLLISGIGIVAWRIALAGRVLLKVNPFLILFLSLVALSITWSITADQTVLRFAAIMTTFLVNFSFSLLGWRPARLTSALRMILTTFLFFALLYCAFRPDIAKESGEGISLEKAWKGIFTSKNVFVETAGLGIILWTHAWLTGEVRLWRFLAGAAISAACLLLSDSSTSIFGAAFVMGVMYVLLRPKIRNSRATPLLVVVLVCAIGVYSLAALNVIPGVEILLGPVAKAVGKNTSFSGRSQIWDVVKDHIALQPWYGSGYGAYFIGPVPSSPSYEFILRKMGYFNESHNGYLEVMNDLGAIGLACLFGYIIVYMRQCFTVLKENTQAVLWIGLLFQQMIGNPTESIWFQANALPWVVLTAITVDMGRTLLDRQLRGTEQNAAAPTSRAGRRVAS